MVNVLINHAKISARYYVYGMQLPPLITRNNDECVGEQLLNTDTATRDLIYEFH